MAYSGIYKVKNRAKYKGNPDNVIYRSLWEKKTFAWCERNPKVKSWMSEEFFIPYQLNGKTHRYFPDLLIEFDHGRVLVEIKPKKETVKPEFKGRRTKRYITESLTYVRNQSKWEAAESFAKLNDMKFEVWTEETLQSMGILPKPLKKMKKLKPLKAAKKK